MTRIKHFRNKCIGCAYCVEIAPGFWKMNIEDGRCDLIGSLRKKDFFELEIFDDEIDRNRKASDICPGKCIQIKIY